MYNDNIYLLLYTLSYIIIINKYCHYTSSRMTKMFVVILRLLI